MAIIYSDEVCKILGLLPGSFPGFRKDTPDFPTSLGLFVRSGVIGKWHGFDADQFNAWLEPQRRIEARWISSHAICARLKIKHNCFNSFRKKHPDFPKPEAMKRLVGAKFRALQFSRAAFDAWLETADWQWATQADDEDEDMIIRHSSPDTRPRLTPPNSLEFKFIAGHFASPFAQSVNDPRSPV
ncbi:MAG: hypothetical protein Q7U98_17080 [Methylicorpusculum sp.]|uniref:hypothetical protein n=1 Tax=Methylicorpusculum sp. TaxID=2713644 RepID=UPI00271DE262|nr:hypothetical protein [Methylicorpusculum sp.]MDO8940870.1 hypothetical protein [Methylicorpusculum sp.]MDP2202438.1 hypothetical protein [Methylicorpusculum sp.]